MTIRRRRIFDSDAEPYINLTPLLDVLFVLLVTYILISPFLLSEKIDLATGRGAALENIKKENVHLFLSAEDQILYQGKKMTGSEAAFFLKDLHEKKPRMQVMVSVDKKTHFEAYQRLKFLIEDAGFESVDLVVSPEHAK